MRSDPTTGVKMNIDQALRKGFGDQISTTYLSQGSQSRTTRSKLLNTFLVEKKWPQEGWDELTIEWALNELAIMDSNNFVFKSGVGEREGRVFSALVQKRHYRFSHGIGRSGDLGEVQPKAAGSSTLSVLANSLARQLCEKYVSRKVADAFISPVATGMSICLVLLTLRKEKPAARYVLWPRIDQKSCFKCISTAGYEAVIIEPLLVGDELRTNLPEIRKKVAELGAENVLCVLSTTSCFAPRACDAIEEIGKLCLETDIHHIVNNAYGVQSGKCMYEISQAAHHGRVDIVVQSTDKNLMVPVGGAIIAGFDKNLVNKIRKNYPGRASSSQSLDVFLTMMSMGSNGYERILKERKRMFDYLKAELSKLADSFGERVLETPNNQISIGMTLSNISQQLAASGSTKSITELGSMLFMRSVCGARVIPHGSEAIVEGTAFKGWGSHTDAYPCAYLTVASSIGIETKDVDFFISKLNECLHAVLKK